MSSDLSFLYVEDDKNSREVMKILLRDVLGYTRVMIWADSNDFDNRLNSLSEVPDIIFLDIHLEPLNGFEMLTIVRKNAQLTHTKVIALTASIMATEVDDLRNAGFDGLIAKPLNQSEFPSMVKRIMQGETIWDELWD